MKTVGERVALICGPLMVREKARRWRQQVGKLVQFDKKGRVLKPRPQQHGQGEILMFTGVHYTRTETEMPDKPPANARPKRKRG